MGTYTSDAAEREANKIGLEFANSKDVVGDMSRAYHVDFSNVNIHTDAAANSRVHSAGKDALAQGNDLFFGKGVYESHTPESNALVAHELAHTMQQGAVGDGIGVAEHAPAGAEQGGLLDWFRNLFSRKKKNQEVASQQHAAQQSAGAEVQETPAGLKIENPKDSTDGELSFMTPECIALYTEMKNKSLKDLRTDKEFQKRVLDEYVKCVKLRMKQYENDFFEDMSDKVFDRKAGEVAMYNKLVMANMSDDMIMPLGKNYNVNDTQDKKYEALSKGMTQFSKNLNYNDNLRQIFAAGMEGMSESVHFAGKNQQNRYDVMASYIMKHTQGRIGAMAGRRGSNAPKNFASAGMNASKMLKDRPDLQGVQEMQSMLRNLDRNDENVQVENEAASYKIPDGSGKDAEKRFQSTKGRAIYQMMKNVSNEDVRGDAVLRREVLSNYKTDMQGVMSKIDSNTGYTPLGVDNDIFRKDTIGEMANLNSLFRKSITDGMIQQMYYGFNKGGVDGALQAILSVIKSDTTLREIVAAGMSGIQNSAYYSGEKMMHGAEKMANNFVLRCFTTRLDEYLSPFAKSQEEKTANAMITAQMQAVMNNKTSPLVADLTQEFIKIMNSSGESEEQKTSKPDYIMENPDIEGDELRYFSRITSDEAKTQEDSERIKALKQRRFQSSQARALADIIYQASPEQVRGNKAFVKHVLDIYERDMHTHAEKLKKNSGNGFVTAAQLNGLLRGNASGEMEILNLLLQKVLPTHVQDKFASGFAEKGSANLNELLNELFEDLKEDELVSQVMLSGMKGVSVLGEPGNETDEVFKAERMMSNILLRGVMPAMGINGDKMRNSDDPELQKKGSNYVNSAVAALKAVPKMELKALIDFREYLKELGKQK